MRRVSVFIFLCFACFMQSCVEDNSRQNISPVIFELDGGSSISAEASTKAVVFNDNLTEATVKAYATRNNTVISTLNGSTLTRQSTGYWKPATNTAWIDGSSYEFCVYAYSGNISNVSADGSRFTVAEPTSYDYDSMADFVISGKKAVSASESSSHPLIELQLNHVLSSVVVYMVKDPSMKTVNMKSITIQGFYNQGELENSTDGWIATTRGEPTAAVYTESGTFEVTTDRATTDAFMELVVVPQQLTQRTKLTVVYEVDESPDSHSQLFREHTQEFVLSDYGKTKIEPGHRATFFMTVDTGIHLTASIVPWKDVDFIEGTVLPAI